MTYNRSTTPRQAFSLLELLAVVAILGVLSTMIVARVATPVGNANANACHTLRGEIELQAQLWFRSNGSFPEADLSDIGVNPLYFPQGLPTCPVDGSSFTIDTDTGRVLGHNHGSP